MNESSLEEEEEVEQNGIVQTSPTIPAYNKNLHKIYRRSSQPAIHSAILRINVLVAVFPRIALRIYPLGSAEALAVRNSLFVYALCLTVGNQ